MLKQRHAEIPVLVTPGCGLRHEEVRHAQAVAHPVVRVAVLDPVYALKPAGGQDGGVGPDALGVVAVSLVELRAFANRTIYLLSEVGGLRCGVAS